MKQPWTVAEKLMTTGKHAYLWSELSGIGKTFLAQKRQGHTIICHDAMQPSEIIGHPWPSGAVWEWKDGPAVDAWRQGVPLILNELPEASPDVQNVLLTLLDSVESAQMTLPTGERIRPKKGYVCVATGNNNPEEALSKAFLDRVITLHLTKPHPDLIARISAELPELGKLVAQSYDSGQNQISCRKALDFLWMRNDFDAEVAAELCFGKRGQDILAMLPAFKEAK